jgi:hypothetical protein
VLYPRSHFSKGLSVGLCEFALALETARAPPQYRQLVRVGALALKQAAHASISEGEKERGAEEACRFSKGLAASS